MPTFKHEGEMRVKECRQLNVLWLVDHLGYDGFMHGAGSYYLNTIPRFDRDRFSITLCVLRARDSLTARFEKEKIRVQHFGRSKFSPLTLLDLVSSVRTKQVSLIHAHGYGSSNFARLARNLCGVPVILHAHDDDPNYPFYQGIADYLLSPFTDKAIAVSESVKKSCLSKRRMHPSKLSVMHNGIPLAEFSPSFETNSLQRIKDTLGIMPDQAVVGTVAKLREEKGTRYLIESVPAVLSALPDTVFLIVGDGPLREELENLASRLGVAHRTVFAGFRRDIPAVLSVMDVVAIPSLTEGSPLALLEAMAMGKPIVATRVGGMVEILKDGETGMLVPAKEPHILAEKLVHLLTCRDEADSLAQRARRASKDYDIVSHVRKLEELYVNVTNHGNQPVSSVAARV